MRIVWCAILMAKINNCDILQVHTLRCAILTTNISRCDINTPFEPQIWQVICCKQNKNLSNVWELKFSDPHEYLSSDTQKQINLAPGKLFFQAAF